MLNFLSSHRGTSRSTLPGGFPHGAVDHNSEKSSAARQGTGGSSRFHCCKSLKWLALSLLWMLATVFICYVTSFLAMESFYRYYFTQHRGRGTGALGTHLFAAAGNQLQNLKEGEEVVEGGCQDSRSCSTGTAREGKATCGLADDATYSRGVRLGKPTVVDIWKDEPVHMEDDESVFLQDRQVPSHWTNCVYRMFRLNEMGEEVIPADELEEPIPLMVTILMTDSEFLPRFVCSIDIPVRYWFLVLSGNEEKARKTVDRLELLFNKTGRLIIRREELNRGFAGNMNIGIRWGMNYRTRFDVPWFLLSNVDTAFGEGVLAKMARVLYQQAAEDGPVLDALEAEVREEEARVARGDFTWYHRYAPAGRPLKILREGFSGVPVEVHTAPLLPDRIRYMYSHQNHPDEPYDKRYFSKHIGLVYPVSSALPATAVTRLCVGTVGYMDENYHPIYMEDIDWRWRIFHWGFKETHVAEVMERYPNNPYFWHHNGANMVYQHLSPQDTEDNTPRWAYQMSLQRKGRFYELCKTGTRDFGNVWSDRPVGVLRAYRYFSVPYYPSDVWVTDPDHIRCFSERTYDYHQKRWVRPSHCPYSCAVLKNAGVLGEDQARQLDCETFSYDDIDHGGGSTDDSLKPIPTRLGRTKTTALQRAEEENQQLRRTNLEDSTPPREGAPSFSASARDRSPNPSSGAGEGTAVASSEIPAWWVEEQESSDRAEANETATTSKTNQKKKKGAEEEVQDSKMSRSTTAPALTLL